MGHIARIEIVEMKLGINKLGLSNTSVGGGAVVADWANWDGTGDGDVVLFQSGGGRGVPAVAAISDTKVLIGYTLIAANTGDLAVTIGTRSGTTITENGSVDVTSSQQIRQKPSIARLSDTRALVGYTNDTGATDRFEVALIDVSGTTPSVLDTIQETTITADNFENEIIPVSSTRAIWGLSDHILVIDISADTISLGSPTLLSGPAQDSKITMLNSTEGAFLKSGNIYYFSISGTTVTEGATAAYNAGVTGDEEIVRISDTEVIVFYEETTASGPTKAIPYTWTGSAWSAGTAITVYSGRIFTMDSHWAWPIGDTRQAMFSFQDFDDVNLLGRTFIISSDESHALTLEVSDIRPFGDSVVADHITGDVFPNTDNLYAVVVCQEETTSPVKQVGTKILYGG